MKAKVLLILGLIGLGISCYLVAKTADPSSVACSLGGGCETVLASSYAKIFGISVAAYGVAWYLGTIGLIFLCYFWPRVKPAFLSYYLALGLLFSLYLLSLEMFKIHAYCTWCLTSLTVVILMIITQALIIQQAKKVVVQ